MEYKKMSRAIECYCDGREYCTELNGDEECPLYKIDSYSCWSGSEEYVKSNYELIFGKQSDKFTLSDIKSGYLCRIKDGTLLLVIPTDDDYWELYDEDMDAFTTKNEYNLDMTDKDSMSEFDIIEVYSYTSSDYSGLFETYSRELLYKREGVVEEDDIDDKEYEIDGLYKLRILPNGRGYKDRDTKPIFIQISDDENSYTSISIESAKQLIQSLQEIVDYVEGDK